MFSVITPPITEENQNTNYTRAALNFSAGYV